MEGDVLRRALVHELAASQDDEVVEEEEDPRRGLVDREDHCASGSSYLVHLLDDVVSAGRV